jgi:hypothetical protein
LTSNEQDLGVNALGENCNLLAHMLFEVAFATSS